jgi:TonB-dependent starch-binding outer membrane protein SusC
MRQHHPTKQNSTPDRIETMQGFIVKLNSYKSMKKNVATTGGLVDKINPIVLKIMKISFFLLLVCTFSVNAAGYSQTRISISAKDVSIRNVLREIESKSDYTFFYNEDFIDLNKKITCTGENEPVVNLLASIENKTDLDFQVLENNLVVITTEMPNNQKVTGTVTDEKGETIPGVNIQVEGTNIGTTTDINGKFTIELPSENGVLIFTFIGYTDQKISVKGGTSINVTMILESTAIEGVVVVGYGSQKKSDITGSISSVKGENLEKLSTKRLDQALQGQVAGITVQNTDGAPGGKTVIRIRGSNSVLGGNNALVVVDGLQGVDMSLINPGDIASIEVLKDASATAIYGSRGANGVVLVTTKSGKQGKPKVTYSMYAGVQSLSHKLDLLNAGDYATYINKGRALRNELDQPAPVFTEQQIADFYQNGGTDWQNEIYQSAPIQNHQITVSGGTKDFDYFVSGGFLKQDGIMLNSGYDRYSLRTNLTSRINKWLSIGVNASAIKSEGKSPAFGEDASGQLSSVVLTAPRWGATMPVLDANGNYSKFVGYGPYDTWNPVASAVEVDPTYSSINNIANAYLDFKIIEGLTLRINGAANITTSADSKYYNEKTKEGLEQNGKVGFGTIANGAYKYYQNTNMLTYDKTFDIHHITLTGVAEQSVGEWNGSSIEASQFTVGTTGLYDLGGAGQKKINSSYNKRGLNSYMGRINYALMDKYLLTVSYRADGSSVFGANTKWGYFPSASLAWKLSEEDFIKQLEIFTALKLRASYGTIGNQAIEPYQTQPTIGSGEDYPFDGTNVTNVGFGIKTAGNPDLRWESTTQMNLGLDIAMFKGRLTATIDVYKKKTNDLLLYRQLALSTGLPSIIDNVGSIENKGFELTIGGDPLVGDLTWNTSVNFTLNRNKVLDLGQDLKIPYYTSSGGYFLDQPLMYIVVGESMGGMYGWKSEGLWSTNEKAEAASFGQFPGDPHYTDVNGDGMIDDHDIQKIGSAAPKFIYGWNNSLTYKRFDLNLLFQGVYGNNIFNQPKIRLESQDQATSTRILESWTPENQNTDMPAYISDLERVTANYPNKIIGVDARTTHWVEDGSYFRLKNLTLGYTFDTEKLSKIGMDRLRVYLSGTNLLTFTKYTGYDPEVSSYNGNDGSMGVDFGNYPSSKIVSFGLDITF